MESNHTMSYDVDKSSERMDEILNAMMRSGYRKSYKVLGL